MPRFRDGCRASWWVDHVGPSNSSGYIPSIISQRILAQRPASLEDEIFAYEGLHGIPRREKLGGVTWRSKRRVAVGLRQFDDLDLGKALRRTVLAGGERK